MAYTSEVLQYYGYINIITIIICELIEDLAEEVPVKWMDRPSATEMERGRASEIDRRKSAKTWKCH